MARLSKSWSGGNEVSKFKKILDVASEGTPQIDIDVQQQNSEDSNNKTAKKTQPTKKTTKKSSLSTQSTTSVQTDTPKRGRPKGKRSHPDYEQVTAYIKKETHTAAKIELLKEGQKRQFSELIQELLDDWVESRS